MRWGSLVVAAAVQAVGCVAIPSLTAPPASYAYKSGVGTHGFRYGMSVVLDAIEGALSDVDAQVTFRHADRRQALIKAKTKNGKPIEIKVGAEGIATAASVKFGYWGNRDETDRIFLAINRRLSAGAGEPADAAPVQNAAATAAPVEGGQRSDVRPSTNNELTD